MVTVEQDDTIHWDTFENVDPLVKLCKEQRDMGVNRKSSMRPVAHVPETVVMASMREGWFHDTKRWKQWVNDRDNKAFRCSEGRF